MKKRMVGPFIFLDHMGPAHFNRTESMTVNAHPHIGLSTLTYLFEGRIHHKDSLGSSVTVIPGEVNWMTAGRGISHSEKTADEDLGQESNLHGLQFWVALPDELEDIEPSFFNFKKNQIPTLETKELSIDVIVGDFKGLNSPVATYSPLIFLNIMAHEDCFFSFPNEKNHELALYLINGSISVEEKGFKENEMIVFESGSSLEVKLSKGAHCVLIGGETFQNPKQIWWNFVSSSKEKIDTARKNWNEGNFPQVPGEKERILAP